MVEILDVARSIDKLLSVDIGHRGIIDMLYQASLAKTKMPLVYAAAKELSDKVKPGETVLIATGFPCRPWISPNIGEADGPAGAAVLAKAIIKALGAVPVLMSEEGLANLLRVACKSVGLQMLDWEVAKKTSKPEGPYYTSSVHIRTFPYGDHESAKKHAEQLLRELDPKVLVCIERPGMNEKGVYHSYSGIASDSRAIAKIDHLFERARTLGLGTIGIADGGNDLGMGTIRDVVRTGVPFGKECRCPCKAGIAPATETGILVAPTVSNWGAYGIASCLAMMHDRPDIVHDGQTEQRLLEMLAYEGATQGFTALANPGTDTLTPETHVHVVEVLKTMTLRWFDPRAKQFWKAIAPS